MLHPRAASEQWGTALWPVELERLGVLEHDGPVQEHGAKIVDGPELVVG